MKRNWFWGMFLLLSAAFIIASTRFDFMDIGLPSIIGTLLCAAFIIHMLARGWFAGIFFPLGILYYIYQSPLGLPFINAWLLLAAALCATIGLAILMPRKKWSYTPPSHSTHVTGGSYVTHNNGTYTHNPNPNHTNLGSTDEDFPVLNVDFGGVSRYLHSQNLKGGRFHCRFGSLEVFLDNAKLAPEGATFEIDCSLGATVLHVPRDWPVSDQVNSSLGGVEIGPRRGDPVPGAPVLTLVGDVHLGALEVRFI